MPDEPDPSILLPDGACLLHIGPPKTGTTAVQAAFWAARKDVLAQGVRYAGRSRHETVAAQAVGRSLDGRPDPPTIAAWHRLAREVATATEPRVVLSSETLSYASAAAARRIHDDLAPRRIHVVVTLRPIARILPSAWQQFVKNGQAIAYEPWLEATLLGTGRSPTPLFWRQERHDELVARWAAVAGPEHLTAVVADERDREALLRTFEGFTGLRTGTLRPVEDLANRSMTLPEVEAVRALNERLRAEGFGLRDIDRTVRGRAALHLLSRRPDPEEPRIQTPAWALERAREIALETIAGLRRSGVRVLGDLDHLATVPEPAPAAPEDPAVQLARAREVGAWLAAGMYQAGRREPALEHVSTRELAGTAAARMPGSLRRRFAGLGRRS